MVVVTVAVDVAVVEVLFWEAVAEESVSDKMPVSPSAILDAEKSAITEERLERCPPA